ncbi:RNA polymerase sigma factor [Thermomonospora cellulosilytica]|uniref:DNA-directed RNA polymerase specialized sigma24 family protein n=1 Tax=Thermomonospora cellulosilytica TaxID=1411118 RepID=A0A7W3R6G9_9ACTN|nr:sigma-70 family RNA polymerase sigma factor [Thermomonospora cellulosilytica]MBA9001516.1 DNA-directed RNA polymerase specialized sigma24 family protein [Thermomonospora cellulosilytica]
MNDHALVGALRSGDLVGPAALYDAYAERLYRYCRFRLPDDAARAALVDAFAAAGAHVHRLKDPGRFGPWLYAMTRLECLRREDAQGHLHPGEESGQRLTAWRAVQAMPPMSREILELKVRHQLAIPDLAAVLDLSQQEIRLALTRAHTDLEEALSAELLALQGAYGCPQRAAILRRWNGDPLTASLRRRLLKHARDCTACSAYGPRTVAPAKVYALLPNPLLPPSLRERVLTRLRNPDGQAGADITFGLDGFPVQSRSSMGQTRPDLPETSREGSGWTVALVTVGTVALVLMAATLAWLGQGKEDTPTTAAPEGALPSTASSERPWALDGTGPSPTWPLGAKGSSAPPTARPTPPVPATAQPGMPGASRSPGRPGHVPLTGMLAVAPRYIDLGGGCDGTIELLAQGGPIEWKVRTPSRVRLSQTSGKLANGQYAVLRLRVNRRPGSRGQEVITFQPGGVQVVVTWRTIPRERPNPRPTRPDRPTRPAPGRPTSTAPTTSPTRPDQSQTSTSTPSTSQPPPSSDPPQQGSGQPTPPPASGPSPSPEQTRP